MELVNRKYTSGIIRVPKSDINKNDAGNILIIAGMGGMAGAAIMSAKASLRSGAGLVRIGTDKESILPIQTNLPEAICLEVDRIWGNMARVDGIAIGPGMGNTNETKSILEKLLRETEKPLVIDADGLNAVSNSSVLQKLVREYPGEIVMTPHEREAARLLGVDVIGGREETCLALIEKYNCTVLLKGPGTLVGSKDHVRLSEDSGESYKEEIRITKNTTGNPGMATAGSGDALTGVILAFIGRGIEPKEAARVGCYIHGRAGDLAEADLGDYGMMARDLVSRLPIAIKEIVEEKDWRNF